MTFLLSSLSKWFHQQMTPSALQTRSPQAVASSNLTEGPLGVSVQADGFTRQVATPQTVSDFFAAHPEHSPRSILQADLLSDNERGEGGKMFFYPAKHPKLQGVGFLLPKNLKQSGQPAKLPEGLLRLQPASPSVLHDLPDVGAVLGTIGPVLVVRKMPGEVVGNYYDLPCVHQANLEFINYFHNIDRFNAMTVADRREDIRSILADPKKAKQDRVISLLLEPSFFKQFESVYLKQIQRLAELDGSVYQKAVATLLKIRSAGQLPDFNHPMNLLIEGQGKSAQFGFIDIEPLKSVAEMPSFENQLLGFGLNLVGGGLGHFGPLWLMVSDEAEIALNQDIPKILHHLEQAAKANGIAFPTPDLKRAMKRRSNLPSLHTVLT